MAKTICIRQAAGGDAVAERAGELLERVIRERTGEAPVAGAPDFTVHMAVDPGVGEEGFRIEDAEDGVRVVGDDGPGLIYGVGRFLREGRFDETGFTPGTWRGASVPEKPVRGMYFATHFHNFYHDAPVAEVERYVEDLALWGCNTLAVWFDMHHFEGIDDPAAEAMVERLRRILRTANAVGMGAVLTTIANEGYNSSPEILRADGSAGHDGYHRPPRAFYGCEVCPSKPGGLDYILKTRADALDAFANLDVRYVWIWPYDSGGCTCGGCAPWGCNGFLRCAEPLSGLVRERWPAAKVILSTWYFDHFTTGEWEGLSEAFAGGPPPWADLILADDYSGFPEYPLRHGSPGGLPVVGFPEISMEGMFPWGGFGANPRPGHWQDYWDTCGHLLDGVFPYSEGIFEDINKVITLQLCWDPGRRTEDIVREYAASEFSPGTAARVAEAVALLEAGLDHSLADGWKEVPREGGETAVRERLEATAIYRTGQAGDPQTPMALLGTAEATMPDWARRGWRWRVLRGRAELDAELHASGGRPTERTEAVFGELAAIYHNVEPHWPVATPSLKRIMRLLGVKGA